MKGIYFAVIAATIILSSAPSPAADYSLAIARETVNITGNPVRKITLNGTIPGPVLRFTEGEDVSIAVTNHLDEDSSVHWHGLLLPGEMDGVPGFNGFPGIKPGATFTYRFKARQAGTYWYHAHSVGQEQDGHYGSIVISPQGKDPVAADRDYVVLISDFHDEDADGIFANLKMSSEYYQYARRTVGDFFQSAREKGFGEAWSDAKMWGEMRMLPTDLSDVSGYTYLLNGRTEAQNWTGLFKPGERVRLRFINASSMSFYDVRIPGLKMEVVQADGQGVEPVAVDEFRFGVAETYDVVVTPNEDRAYTIAAESVDRTGFARGTLAPREGMTGPAPEPRKRTLLTMADMGMDHGAMDHGAMNHGGMGQDGMDHSKMAEGAMDHGAMNHGGMDHAAMAAPKMDHSGMNHDTMGHADREQPSMDHSVSGATANAASSGWADAGTPPGHRALSYADLRYAGIQKDTRPPGREILVELGGNMERYIWTINGRKFEESGPINLSYGERVRLKFVNTTMMAHPMHLHGMFVQLENGQPASKLPNKHTVIVPPGQSYSVLLTADEAGEWAFHCHLLYHMMAGMMTKVVVAKLDPSAVPQVPAAHAAGHGSVKAPALPPKDSGASEGAMDHSTMDHGTMDHGTMDHSTMDHGQMTNGAMDHSAMGHGAAKQTAPPSKPPTITPESHGGHHAQ